jgi:ribonuclease inhibitor
MKNVILDCSLAETTAGLHLQLSELLDLPEYYGGNLDALADCLSELHQDTCLILEQPEALLEELGDYAERFFRLLEHCANENPFFHVEMTSEQPAVPTAPAMKLAEAYKVEMPLAMAVNAVVNLGADPREAIAKLMARDQTTEVVH